MKLLLNWGPSVAKNEQMYANVLKKRGELLGNAQAKDAQMQTQVGIIDSPLIAARYGSYGDSGYWWGS